MSGRKLAPEVGISYLVGDKLWIDATPVAQGMNAGNYAIHERDHQRYWKQLVRLRAVPETVFSMDV